ncbi:Pol polyprotein [Plakobranchus ocellatus]|uniref:Pol polyprotein n=1 Tax=Plakobranchus ocellatus TaxID=259542 RepID=A0AAV4D941_9GAST|nr:Pol polyprotein [Plakobranchus ocellatus]
MRKAVGHLPHVASYFDDILIHSASWEDHLLDLEATLQALRQHNLTGKPSKIFVGYTSIEFLGHIVEGRVVRPDETKIEKILNIQPCTTKQEVQSISGLLNFYRRFIPNFSDIARPLTDLTRKKSPKKVVWSARCQHSLDTLKKTLTSKPVLQLPDLSNTFFVQSDASNKAIGAALLQQHGETLLPCYYASRKLLDREIKYPIIEKECLAVVFALYTFSKYLLMRPFILMVDHKPLSFLRTRKTKNSRLMRWALSLQQFSFRAYCDTHQMH